MKYMMVDAWAENDNGLDQYSSPFIQELSKYNELLLVCHIYNTKKVSICRNIFFPFSSKYKSLKNLKLVRGLEYTLGMLRTFYLCLRHKPEVIHFQWLLLPIVDLFIIGLLRKMSNVYIVYTAHNVRPHNAQPSSLTDLIYRRLDLILVHAETLKIEFLAKHEVEGSKVYSIGHGAKRIEKVRESISRSLVPHENYAVFAGLINNNKGVFRLVEFWIREKIELPLVIMGQCNVKELYGLINNANSDVICFIDNFVSDEEFQAVIQNSSWVLLPYISGSVSGVIFNAAAASKPLLSTNFGGIKEYVRHKKTGLIAETWSEFEEYAKRLNEFDGKKMGLENKKFIETEYNWTFLTEKYQRLLESNIL